MVDTQHFCLRWNNYQSSITSAFENLRDDEDFVDVTLACDGKSLKAHRVVLSACSPYFRELLKSTPCKHPVIVLQDVAWTDLHALVEFIYHGEVNVHQRSLSSFLKTAEVLRVSGLTQQHAQDRSELAQVQSLIRPPSTLPPSSTPSQLHPSPSPYPPSEESPLFPPSPPHGATVNQLLRRAQQAHHRRDRLHPRHCPPDTETEMKRARMEHVLNNNNNDVLGIPPQTQPADFSPSGMKNNVLNLKPPLTSIPSLPTDLHAPDLPPPPPNNGLSSTDPRSHSPCSQPSPRNEDSIKSEPMELLHSTAHDGDSDDSATAANNGALPQGPHSGSSTGDPHEDHDSPIGAYLSSQEGKLFQAAAASGSFNFSMAALAADPGLGGLNASLQANADTLAGTSQGASPKKVFTCQLCGKVLCSKASLKRHIADKHAERQEEYRCVICERVYCSRNSLMTHIYTYHKSRPGDIDIKFF